MSERTSTSPALGSGARDVANLGWLQRMVWLGRGRRAAACAAWLAASITALAPTAAAQTATTTTQTAPARPAPVTNAPVSPSTTATQKSAPPTATAAPATAPASTGASSSPSAPAASSPKPLNTLTPTAGAPAAPGTRPWATGVSPDAQVRAKTLFAEGTDFLLRSLEEQAIAKYDEALKHWNHPGVHYNYAVALSTQDRALETRAHLLEALRYGDNGPLDKLEVEQARRYLKLVEGSLALIDIHTEQQGVLVSLNGQILFTGPGQFHKFVAPDEYLVTATKPGYIAQHQRIAFLPGRTNQVAIHLYSEQDLTRYRRRWPTWGPITLTAVGGLAAIGGGAAWLLADQKYDEYDAAVTSACPAGCNADDPALTSLEPTRQTADRYDTLTMPLLIGGGVAVAAGAVLLYLNRAEPYQITPKEAGVEQFSLLPAIGPSSAALVGQGRF